MAQATNSGSITADNNWWGRNGGPATNDVGAGAVTVAKWLQLKLSASPATIVTNQTSGLTASFLSNNLNEAISNTNLTAMVGVSVLWSGVGGSVTGQQTTVQAAGTATATYNETTGVAGAHSALAVVDSTPPIGSTNTVAFTVNKANATTVINSDSPDPTVTGQGVAVSYSVTGSSGNSPTVPTGNVQVSDGVNSNTGTVAAGSATVGLLTAGNRTLTATYQGDANFNASPASAGAGHLVNKADTTATIISDNPDPSVVGQQITVTYSVAVTAPGSGTPTGNVLVSDGVNSATGTVAAGSVNITLNTIGNRTLTATYQGDANYNASPASVGAGHTVNKANTSLSGISDAPDPSLQGQSVTVTYVVNVTAPGGGTPTGSITVSDGVDNALGTLAGGSGSASITLNTAGVRTLTVTYSGDANFNGSNSTAGHLVSANQPPVPGAVSVQRYPTQSVKVPVAQITGAATDSDPGDTISLVSVANGANGTAQIVGTYVLYTPTSNFPATHTFPYTIQDNHGAQATGTVTVNVIVDNAPSQNITKVMVQSDGSVAIDFAGIPGYTYGLQYTPTLAPATWVTLGPVTTNAVGAGHAVDGPPPAGMTSGFYRLVFPYVPPAPP